MFWLKIFQTDSYYRQNRKDKSTVEWNCVYLCLIVLWYGDESKSYLFDLVNTHSSIPDYAVNSASLCCSCLWFSLKAMRFFWWLVSMRNKKVWNTLYYTGLWRRKGIILNKDWQDKNTLDNQTYHTTTLNLLGLYSKCVYIYISKAVTELCISRYNLQ